MAEPALINATGRLEDIMALIRRLRAPEGCPWDRKQTPPSLANYLIEEVHELAAAITAGDDKAIREELGDVIFQILFLVEMYQDAGTFDLSSIVTGNLNKMVRRHPHVFGSHRDMTTDEIRANWHAIKKKEKESNAGAASLLASIPRNLPALMRAYRISERAGRAGFDWPDLSGVMAKVEEEWQEFKSAQQDTRSEKAHQAMAMEFGDILFTLSNVARFAGFHPESALAAAVDKFEQRFRWMEAYFDQQGRDIESVGREELESAWERAKQQPPDNT